MVADLHVLHPYGTCMGVQYRTGVHEKVRAARKLAMVEKTSLRYTFANSTDSGIVVWYKRPPAARR